MPPPNIYSKSAKTGLDILNTVNKAGLIKNPKASEFITKIQAQRKPAPQPINKALVKPFVITKPAPTVIPAPIVKPLPVTNVYDIFGFKVNKQSANLAGGIALFLGSFAGGRKLAKR
jgi:hypothetical protein